MHAKFLNNGCFSAIFFFFLKLKTCIHTDTKAVQSQIQAKKNQRENREQHRCNTPSSTSRTASTRGLRRRRRRRIPPPAALTEGTEELQAQRRRRAAVTTSSDELDLKTTKHHRPGTHPKLPPFQARGQRQPTSPEVARTSTCTPPTPTAAPSEPIRQPPLHRPRSSHRHRRERRQGKAAAIRCRRRRRQKRGEAAAQQNDDGGHPISATSPTIRPNQALFTPPERRSGDSPSSRRRSGRRRVGNPPDTPADAGESEVALEITSGTVDREGGKRVPEIHVVQSQSTLDMGEVAGRGAKKKKQDVLIEKTKQSS